MVLLILAAAPHEQVELSGVWDAMMGRSEGSECGNSFYAHPEFNDEKADYRNALSLCRQGGIVRRRRRSQSTRWLYEAANEVGEAGNECECKAK